MTSTAITTPTAKISATSTATAIASPATATATPFGNCAPPVTLGTASSYVILAGSTITNTGLTTLCGGLGLSPGTSVTGAPVVACSGVSNVADAAAVQAEDDLGTAYTEAANLKSNHTITAGSDIGGQTLFPGVYADSGVLNIGSNVTLDGRGNPCAFFVFQVAGGLTVSTAGVHVILTGGAQASNVYWQVAGVSALGASVSFVGTIMDYTSISIGSDAVLNGRALAETGQVALSSDSITLP